MSRYLETNRSVNDKFSHFACSSSILSASFRLNEISSRSTSGSGVASYKPPSSPSSPSSSSSAPRLVRRRCLCLRLPVFTFASTSFCNAPRISPNPSTLVSESIARRILASNLPVRASIRSSSPFSRDVSSDAALPSSKFPSPPSPSPASVIDRSTPRSLSLSLRFLAFSLASVNFSLISPAESVSFVSTCWRCVLSCRSPCARKRTSSACWPDSLRCAMGGSYVGSGGVPARRGVPASVPPRARSRSLCLELDDGPREGPGVESIFFLPVGLLCLFRVRGEVRADVAVLRTADVPSRLNLCRYNG